MWIHRFQLSKKVLWLLLLALLSGERSLFARDQQLVALRMKDKVDLQLEAEDRAFVRKHKKTKLKHVHSRTPVGLDLDFGVLHLALAIARGHLDASENLLNQGSASHIQRTAELLKVKGLKAAGAGGLVYDADGRLVEEKLTNGTSVHFRYDDKGRLLLATFPDGDALHFHYDFMGGIEKVDPHVKGSKKAVFADLAERFRSTINHLTHLTGMDNGISPLKRAHSTDEELGMVSGEDSRGVRGALNSSNIEKKTTDDDLSISVKLSSQVKLIGEKYSERDLDACLNDTKDGVAFIQAIRGIQGHRKDEVRTLLNQLRSRLRTLESSENPAAAADEHDKLHSEVVNIQEQSIQITKTVEDIFYLDPESSCSTCVNCVMEKKELVKTKICPKNSLCRTCFDNLPQAMRLTEVKEGECSICIHPPCNALKTDKK